MTTMIRVINEGPSKVRVSAFDPSTGVESKTVRAVELEPKQTLDFNAMYVYGELSVRIDEVKEVQAAEAEQPAEPEQPPEPSTESEVNGD